MRNLRAIESFFHPQSIAVIGASDRKGTIGYTIFENMKNAKVRKIFPVNPNHEKVQGFKSYHSIIDVGEGIDLAVIAVPSRAVPQVLEECMMHKVKSVIIITAGFSEAGEMANTHKIERLIRENPGTRVMGPNCVGVLNNLNGVDTTFFERNRMKRVKRGKVSFISQSGALGSMIMDWIATQEFGVNKFASYGNAMDVDEADLLEYLGEDKDTKVITMYIEGAREGRKFYEIAKRVSRKKPIIVLKGGKSEGTRAAAASHTGSLAGSARVYQAAFKQAGIIEADDLLDLFNCAKVLSEEPLPAGNRVQIITNGGGFGIITADQLIAHGMQLAALSARSARALKMKMPVATISNPIDLLGDADAYKYRQAIGTAISDPNVDIVVVLILFTLPTLNAEDLSLITKPKRAYKKPLIVIAMGSEYSQKYLGKIEKAGFTTFNYPSVAANAMEHALSYSKFLAKG